MKVAGGFQDEYIYAGGDPRSDDVGKVCFYWRQFPQR